MSRGDSQIYISEVHGRILLRVAPPIQVSEAERLQLDRWCSEANGPSKRVLRSWIVLRCAQGKTNQEISREFLVDQGTVALWRRRFLIHRLEGIRSDAPRSGRTPRVSAALIRQVVEASLRPPTEPGQRVSSRVLARQFGVSQATVIRIWQTHGLPIRGAPREEIPRARIRQQVRDVVGLYLGPTHRAVVVLLDDLPEPHPPSRFPRTVASHVRQQTSHSASVEPPRSDLLEALRALYALKASTSPADDPRQEFLLFLRGVDRNVPPDVPLYLVLDSPKLATDTSVIRWLRDRPRFRVHTGRPNARGTPGGFLWPKAWTDLGGGQGSSLTLGDIIQAFRGYSASVRYRPGPFVWTATVDVAHRLLGRPIPLEASVPLGLAGLSRWDRWGSATELGTARAEPPAHLPITLGPWVSLPLNVSLSAAYTSRPGSVSVPRPIPRSSVAPVSADGAIGARVESEQPEAMSAPSGPPRAAPNDGARTTSGLVELDGGAALPESNRSPRGMTRSSPP